MKLTYQILWVEDESDFIDSFDTDALRGHIEGQGFDIDIEYRTSPGQIKAAIDGSKYDLLVIDFQIAEDDFTGGDIIRRVREGNCLTEVIFYSTNGVRQLREVAAEKELEGVFFSGRDTNQLLRKIEDVFNLTVRKVVDLENMRGIVMAGVADLDHLVSDVIRAIHDRLDAGQQIDLCKKLLARMRPVVNNLKKLVRDKDHVHFGEIEKLIDAIVALNPSDFEALISARSFDSSRRVDMLVNLSKGDERLKPHKDDFGAMKELLEWRNVLAHQKPKAQDAFGHPIFTLQSGRDASFDSGQTLELRKSLRVHQARLKAVLEAISKAD